MLENRDLTPKSIAGWEYTLSASVEAPVYGGAIIDRFAQSSAEQPLTLFIPWGVSPTRTAIGRYEEVALDWTKRYSELLLYYGVPNRPLIMPADVYAVEINGDDPDRVAQCFSSIGNVAERLGFPVVPWSTIREQNRDRYEDTLKWECSLEALWQSTPKALWYDGFLPASFSRNMAKRDDVVRQSAFRYLQERIAEARVIEAAYAPVKLSMVSKQKDDIVDRELPRIYILDKKLRFPWLKGEQT
ncbi:hypothetical protein HY409_00605 [Candidatus Gottesmanbacteria bacterium]|nr:hypothetical protein [Candidatus Gottesmanbacteria bacterium]